MTTKTDITQERADFEAAYASAYPTAAARPDKFDREGWGDYVDTSVGIGWRMWQAGRAAVEADRQGRMPSDDEVLDLVKSYGNACANPEMTATEREMRLHDIRALLSRYSSGQPAHTPCDAGEICIDCQPRRPDGSCPDGPAASAEPNTHIDDDAVDHFAVAMKEKLAQARAKGRSRWFECDPADLSAMLRAHVEKGDPRDVANFCMFLWSLGHPISAAPVAQEPVAWVSKTIAYSKYISDARYRKLRPAAQRWYEPYKCASCAAPVAAQAQPSISLNDDDLDRVATILNRHEAEEIGLWGVVEEIMDAFGERFLADRSTPDHWQSVAELLHARGYVQSAGDIGRVARLLGSVRPEAIDAARAAKGE